MEETQALVSALFLCFIVNCTAPTYSRVCLGVLLSTHWNRTKTASKELDVIRPVQPSQTLWITLASSF